MTLFDSSNSSMITTEPRSKSLSQMLSDGSMMGEFFTNSLFTLMNSTRFLCVRTDGYSTLSHSHQALCSTSSRFSCRVIKR